MASPTTAAEVYAGLENVAGLLAECADRVQELTKRPPHEVAPALEALLQDLAATLETMAGGNDG